MTRPLPPRFRTLVALALLATFAIPAAAQSRSTRRPAGASSGSPRRLENFQSQHRDLRQRLAKDLEALALRCEQDDLPLPAIEIRALANPPQFTGGRTDALPAEVQSAIGMIPKAEAWKADLRRIREKHAAALYLLSRNTLNSGFPNYAYQLVREVAWHNPDHDNARRLLGYVRHPEQSADGTRILWVTPFEREKRRKGEVWDDRFGWITRKDLPRYEAGERNFNGRWMSAAQEAEIRRDFDKAWQIHTEHYLVKTNHSLEAGVSVARKLETFHRAFHELFAAFFTTPEQMLKLLTASPGDRADAPKPHEVHFYATKDEYVRRLAKKIPQIGITNGLYFTGDRVAYFFHDPEGDNDAPLYHEASHQLFYEASPAQRPVAEQAHFWVVEGIACYMESFQPRDDGSYALGDPDFIRFHWARRRLLTEGFHVPIRQFAAMGMREFQSGETEELQKRYSEASGLAHFFMHYDGGRYRDALVEHLIALYNADPRRPDAPPLWAEQLTGTPPDELDRQYAEHIHALEAAAQGS